MRTNLKKEKHIIKSTQIRLCVSSDIKRVRTFFFQFLLRSNLFLLGLGRFILCALLQNVLELVPIKNNRISCLVNFALIAPQNRYRPTILYVRASGQVYYIRRAHNIHNLHRRSCYINFIVFLFFFVSYL